MVEFTQDDEQARLTCRFSGELRTNECMDLQEKIALRVTSFLRDCRDASSEPAIVFDLKEVPFASSVFVRIVLSCIQRVGKDHFTVINANEFLLGLFRTVGLRDVLEP